MSRILESDYGFIKHFIIGLVLILGCYVSTFGDPFSAGALTAWAVSTLVSVAASVAVAGLTYALTPRPKPIDKNKLQGEIQISSVGEDIFINEIYGARGSDGKGGIKTGVNFFYVADIRGVVSSSTASSGGGGKGGKRPETKEHHYYTDLACLVGLNRTRILEIRAGTDVLYRNYPKPTAAQGTHYQCESGTLGGGATTESNVIFASGQAVKMPSNNGTISKSVTGDGNNHAFYFQYLTATDKQIEITINGEFHSIALPPTFGRVESIMIIGSTAVGSTTVSIETPVNDNDLLWLDEIIVGENFADVTEVTRFSGISGVKNYDYSNPNPTYDHLALTDPNSSDYRGSDEFNYQANYDNTGSSEVGLPAGCTLRIYEGTADQLPDPTLQAYYEAKYGAGATPAFRHRCYFVLDNFEITKYGNVPNITVVSESVDFQTLGAMYAHRTERAGLVSSEYDFTDFDNIPIRGYAITSRQAPRTEIEILNRIFDIDVYENIDGEITGVVPDDDVLIQIPASDLDVDEGDSNKNKKPIGLKSVIRNEYELPKRFDFSYFDPNKDFEIGNSYSHREVTVSEKRENIETSLVLTQSEAQKIVDRLHQQVWAEKDAESFTTFYKYGWLKPTDLVEIVSLEGEINRVRLKQRNGNIPGKLDFVGVSRNIAEAAPRIFLEPNNESLSYPWLNVPPHLIGTIIDLAILRSTETVPGIYAACAMTDQTYTFKGGVLVWERETGYESLQTFTAQATIGRTVDSTDGTLDDVPGGWEAGEWDDDSEVTFDLYFGEVETRTDAEVLDSFNSIIIGNELIAFQTATRVTGYPNRWTISRLRRQLKGTLSAGHTDNERVVLLNDAVKFIPLDVSEYGLTRNYAFVSAGQEVESASKFAFTWSGQSQYNTAAYQTTDNAAPVLVTDPPIVSLTGKNWLFKFLKPDRNAFSASLLEYRLVKESVDYFFDIGYSFTDQYRVDGIQLSDWTGPGGPACAGVDLLTAPLKPTTIAQMQSIAYNNAIFDFPVPNGTYDIYIFAYGLSGTNYNLTCIVDGSTEFTGWNPYSDAGNTTKAYQKKIDSITVTGNSCRVQISAVGGAGYDAFSAISFVEIAPKTLSSGIDADDTSMALSNVDGLPSSGKVVVGDETIGYTGISTLTLTGLERGAENSVAASHSSAAPVRLVTRQAQLGDVLEISTPQLVYNASLQYRWRNGYRLNGSDGWSPWSEAADAFGSANNTQPAEALPPPPPSEEPPPLTEDPYDPYGRGFYDY